MTLSIRNDDATPTVRMPAVGQPSPLAAYDQKPVEFWPTAAIRLAIETGDISVWQRIVVALKRDPYGRTARQVEEVVESADSDGINKALLSICAEYAQGPGERPGSSSARPTSPAVSGTRSGRPAQASSSQCTSTSGPASPA